MKKLLEALDLEVLYNQLREDVRATKSVAKRQKLAKRLRIVDAFRRSGLNPTWMIMDVIPVLPPDLRPLVPLEGGRFATSDLNDLYRRVINRNNRLKRLVDLKAPDIIVRNEKRMLQESVDVLFDNGRHGRVITGTNKRPLKSLSDTLKGKQAASARTFWENGWTIPGAPLLPLGPICVCTNAVCPKRWPWSCSNPLSIIAWSRKGWFQRSKVPRRWFEREVPEVWDTLDEVVKEYPVIAQPCAHASSAGYSGV